MTTDYKVMADRNRTQVDATNEKLSRITDSISLGLAAALVTDQQPVDEAKKENNEILVLGGAHGGRSIQKGGTVVQGMPGSIFDKGIVVHKHASFIGCTFQTDDPSQAYLVKVMSGANAMFINCRFYRKFDNPPAQEFAVINTGGKAIFLGCYFAAKGNGTTYGAMIGAGNVIVSNASAAADCQIAYCSNVTGRTLAAGTKTETGNI